MLNALAVVNRCIFGLAMLAIVASWVLLSGTFHADGKLMVSVAIFAVAAPFLYLSNALPERRGRIAQTLVAIPLLLAVPVGTIYGAFALYVVWGAADDEFKPRPMVSAAVTPPPSLIGTPYDVARELQARGASVEAIRAQLVQRQLSTDEIETLLNAIQLRPNTRSKI